MGENSVDFGPWNNTTISPSLNVSECYTITESMQLFYMIEDITATPAVRIPFIMLYTIIFVLSVSGNLFVIVTIAKQRSLHTVRNLFILNLSVSDFLVALTSLPITAYTVLFKVWVFGERLCHAIPMLQGLGINISSFTLTAIAIDRYILIVHPSSQPIKKIMAVLIICGIWIVGVSVTVPSVIHFELVDGYSMEVPICGYFCNEDWQDLTLRKIYGFATLTLQFIVPLILIVYCYSRILSQMSRGYAIRNARNRASGSRSDRQSATLRRQRKTNSMLIGMVVAFGVSWAPRVLFNVLIDLGSPFDLFIQAQPYFYGLLTHCIAMTSAFWNPVLYGYMNETFRSTLRSACPCFSHGLKKTFSSRYAKAEETMERQESLAPSILAASPNTQWGQAGDEFSFVVNSGLGATTP